MMHKKKINELFRRLSFINPDPAIELDYLNGFTLTVAVVLSAQATDVGVNKVTKKLFKLIHDPASMIEFGETNLKFMIKSIGLYNLKTRNIMLLSQKLVHDGYNEMPCDFDYLLSLPGVGRKSANVILNCLYQLPTIAVDTHVFRVSNRLGLVKATNVLKTEEQLLDVIPDCWKLRAHHWLVLHGRYVCKARKPLCKQCVASDLCSAFVPEIEL